MHVIIDNRGRRLCQDGSFRCFANFGSFKECVKVYRHYGHAFNRARVFGHLEVISLSEGESMNAGGMVFNADETICFERSFDKRVGEAGWLDHSAIFYAKSQLNSKFTENLIEFDVRGKDLHVSVDSIRVYGSKVPYGSIRVTGKTGFTVQFDYDTWGGIKDTWHAVRNFIDKVPTKIASHIQSHFEVVHVGDL